MVTEMLAENGRVLKGAATVVGKGIIDPEVERIQDRTSRNSKLAFYFMDVATFSGAEGTLASINCEFQPWPGHFQALHRCG